MRILLDELLDDNTQYGNRQKEVERFIIQKYNEGYFEDDITKLLIKEYHLDDFEDDYISDFVHNTLTTYNGKHN